MKKKAWDYALGISFPGANKILLKMKLTLGIILISFLGALASKSYSQTTKLSLDMKNTSLQDVLEAIENQSEFFFLYSEKIIDVNRELSIEVRGSTIEKILDRIFAGTNVDYTVKGRQIVLTTLEANVFETTSTTQQHKSVSGKVTDSSASPLPGVSIVVKGTTIGTITDLDGSYILNNVPENAVLQFSFVGMKGQEFSVAGKTTISVTLAEDAIGIDEVVAIGYGVQKKKLVTGATIQIAGENLQKMNTISPLTAMQSQSPGLSITKYSGKPGSDFKINIRGLGTIGNSNPLIIIDDVVGGNLNLLNPADIESVDVLKDAASAAIYGARAANGVILVRTKQGKKGKNNISYDGYYGIQNVAKYMDMLDAQQFMSLQEEAYTNSGSKIPVWQTKVPEYDKIMQGWKGTDWQREFTNKNAPIQNHTINMTGGSDMSVYSMGLSYSGQEGIYGQPAAPNYERYSFRLNSDHTIYKNSSFDVIKIGENLLYNYTEQKHGNLGADGIYNNDLRWVTGAPPLMSVYDENGDFTKQIPFGQTGNPIGTYFYRRTGNESKNHNLRINTYLEIQPIKGLVFRSNFGYRLDASIGRGYVPVFDLGGTNKETTDVVDQNLSAGFAFQFDNTLKYKTNINDSHNIDIMVGQSIEKGGMGESINARNRGSIFNSFDYAYLNNVKTINSANVILEGKPWGEHIISSYFGRFNYDYKEKYIATIIMRADGSSNFAKGNQWGYFPSVAGGWVISDESFMESSRKVLDYFKLRASWGQNGNEQINPFQYLAAYSFSGGEYYFGPKKDSFVPGGYPKILPNKDVTWETSEQTNIGFDSRLFNSRMGISVDWYNKTTKDWLVQAPVPAVWGADAPYINGGNIENKGLELVFTWNDKVGDLKYGISANVAFNKNEVTYIDNAEGIIEGQTGMLGTGDGTPLYRAQVGYPISYFYGYKTLGVFQNQAEIDAYTGPKLAGTTPGDLIIADTDYSKVIDPKDKTMIGDPNPDAIFGLSINLEYKGFDYSMSASGVAGNQIIASYRQSDAVNNNYPTQYLGRWHGEGTSNRYPKVDTKVHPNWAWNSDIYVEDGDYLRIQNVSLGYNFKNLFPKMPLSLARLYVAAQNLYTFTGYYGADPEVGYSGNSWSKGIDVMTYPSPRTVMVGLNLKF